MRVKNWHKFQHFKDRSPPWIKFYRDLLDDLDWHELPPASAKALVMIWLIASESKGELPDMKTLAFRLRMTETQLKTIVSGLGHWLEQSDIEPVSGRHQDDCLETERETEKERETEARKRAEIPCPADWIPADAWQSFVEHRQAKRAKLTGKAIELIVKDLEGYRAKGVDPRTVLEWAIKQGHTGLFYRPDPKAPGAPRPARPPSCVRCPKDSTRRIDGSPYCDDHKPIERVTSARIAELAATKRVA